MKSYAAGTVGLDASWSLEAPANSFTSDCTIFDACLRCPLCKIETTDSTFQNQGFREVFFYLRLTSCAS